jgi:hypothetical protein
MEKLWTDEVIIETVWNKFMSKLLAEWEGVILWVRTLRRMCEWLASDSRDCRSVDRDVNSQRRVPCYPRRYHIKSRGVEHIERQSSAHLHIIFTDR